MTMLTKTQIINIAILETLKEKYNLTNSQLLKLVIGVHENGKM